MEKKKVRKRKVKIVRHVMNDDCQACLKKHFGDISIVKELGSMQDFKETHMHMLVLKNSFAYLKKMTTVLKNHYTKLEEADGVTPESTALLEYMDDIGKIIDFTESIRKLTIKE